MPANALFGELGVESPPGVNNSGSSSSIEDQRALQLALELSMLGLSTDSLGRGLSGSPNGGVSPSSGLSGLLHHHHHHHNGGHGGLLESNGYGGLGSLLNNVCSSPTGLEESLLFSSSLYGGGGPGTPNGFLAKKSQNMTECVPVPSSEHVAEIVGRQGCKIKALRAKTNTYIKTPVRGEEPVFVVTGRKEDVNLAKREILSAAEHFSQIRASRKGTPGSSNGSGLSTLNGGTSPTVPPTPIPGQVTIQVRVPYRVVGLVVGPKGATIKRIQQQTHTYIVTPSRDKDPVFEVTGLPDNVQIAKREIEAHIAIRTGSLPLDTGSATLPGDDLTASQSELLASLYKNGLQGLEGLGIGLGLGLGLGAINSLSSSLSSVSGLGLRAIDSNGSTGGNTVGSSSSGGGSLSSLSSLTGNTFNGLGNTTDFGVTSNLYNGLSDLGFSLFDSKWTDSGMNNVIGTTGGNGILSSSTSSEDSYLFGGSGPNSIGSSQTKLSDIFTVAAHTGGQTLQAGSGVSSLWGSFDRDEGLGESPTSETAPSTLSESVFDTTTSGPNSPPPAQVESSAPVEG